MAVSQGAQKAIGIGVFVLCAGIIAMGEMDKKQALEDYNAYTRRIKPHLMAQGKLLEAVGQVSPDQVEGKVAEWVKQSQEIKAKIERKAPTNPELMVMHEKILEGTGYWVELFEIIEASVGKEDLGPQFEEKVEKWQAAWKELDEIEQAYAKRHNLKTE